MNPSLENDGFEIHRSVLSDAQISEFRAEVDLIAHVAGSACVRNLRERSSLLEALSYADALVSLLPSGMRPVRSLLFDKTKSENWPVMWHQDLTIAVAEKLSVPGYGPWSCKEGLPHVQPPVSLLEHMVTIRLHLDETAEANGALRVIPGSHRFGIISPERLNAYDKGNFVSCECRPGDALLMSPLILHSSCRSADPDRRRVIHFEFAREGDLDPLLEWFERGLGMLTTATRPAFAKP